MSKKKSIGTQQHYYSWS